MLVPIPVPPCGCWGRSSSAGVLDSHLQLECLGCWGPQGSPWQSGGTPGEAPHLSLWLGYISVYVCVDMCVVLRLKMVSLLTRLFSCPPSTEEKSLEIWAGKELLLFWQNGGSQR